MTFVHISYSTEATNDSHKVFTVECSLTFEFKWSPQHMIAMGGLNHSYVVRTLGICPGDSLQLVTPLSNQGSLLELVRNNKNKLKPQRLLNWCVQIAKVKGQQA